jgi:hypothetical protein
MLFAIDHLVKWGVGIDFDARMVNVANRIRVSRRADNLQFYVFDLEREPLELIEDLLPEPRVDVVFLLAVCAWIRNWREVIDFASRVSHAILFETTGTDEQQSAQQDHLRKRYRTVTLLADASEDDPGQKRRKLLYCTGTEPLGLDIPDREAVSAG